MAYRNSLQDDALKLVAKKLQSSLAVEGELPENRLATYGDDGDDLMLGLARKIVSGEVDDGWMVVESGNTTAGEITYFEIRLPGEDSLRPTAWEVLWERTPNLGHIVCTSESPTAHHFRP